MHVSFTRKEVALLLGHPDTGITVIIDSNVAYGTFLIIKLQSNSMLLDSSTCSSPPFPKHIIPKFLCLRPVNFPRSLVIICLEHLLSNIHLFWLYYSSLSNSSKSLSYLDPDLILRLNVNLTQFLVLGILLWMSFT